MEMLYREPGSLWRAIVETQRLRGGTIVRRADEKEWFRFELTGMEEISDYDHCFIVEGEQYNYGERAGPYFHHTTMLNLVG